MMREDVTVSLSKDMIDEMVGIAELRGVTLSVLVRDILGGFCRAYRSGTDWTRSDPAVSLPPEGSDAPAVAFVDGSDRIETLVSRISAHDDLIAALQSRISALELYSPAQPASVTPTFPVSAPAALQSKLTSGHSTIAAVIDCDSPGRGSVSDDALVKHREPVSPVFTSIDVTTMGRIDPQKPYSQTEAAVILRVSLSTLRKYVKSGKLPSHKVGRSAVFQGKDLISYLGRTR
jgi:excisionase family DNA binding protein